jgi:hypothetical protein
MYTPRTPPQNYLPQQARHLANLHPMPCQLRRPIDESRMNKGTAALPNWPTAALSEEQHRPLSKGQEYTCRKGHSEPSQAGQQQSCPRSAATLPNLPTGQQYPHSKDNSSPVRRATAHPGKGTAVPPVKRAVAALSEGRQWPCKNEHCPCNPTSGAPTELPTPPST